MSPRKNFYRLAATLAVPVMAITLSGTALFVPSALAQVGPMPPQQRPKQENQILKTLGKLLAPPKADLTEEGEETDNNDEKSANKPHVTAPETDMSTPTQEPHYSSGHPPMLTQPELTNAMVEPPQVDNDNPPNIDHPRLDDPTNPLGLTDADSRLKKVSQMVDAHRYIEAKPSLMQLRQSLVDLTEAHIGLYKVLNQVPSARAQAELEKELALQFAQLRDRAMVEMAKVYISERDYPRAVKELTEVVKSQPRSKLGLRSYEMLQEIGFTEKLQLAQ